MIHSRRFFARLLALVMLVAGLAVAIPAAASDGRDHFKVSIANVAGKRKPPVGRVLENRRPHLMVISEAYWARDHLRTVAERKGYRLRQYGRKHGFEAPGIALLIKNGVNIKSRILLKMTKPWWFNGKKREPRRYPVVRLGVNGRVWHTIGVHFPPGGPWGNNRAAWIESKKRVQRYAANHPNPPVVAAGDFNATAYQCRNHFPGFYVAKGGKVDHTLVKKGRGARVDRVRSDNSPEGMHGWFTFKLSAARR